MAMDTLAKTVLSATRKGLFGRKPLFSQHAKIALIEIQALERKIHTSIPADLRDWLLLSGYGDINEELSFREEWFAPIESGQLKGGARFAQDILGNFYAFDASGGVIYYLSRSEWTFAPVSQNFSEFLEELIRRDYKLVDWIDTLKTQKYEWQ